MWRLLRFKLCDPKPAALPRVTACPLTQADSGGESRGDSWLRILVELFREHIQLALLILILAVSKFALELCGFTKAAEKAGRLKEGAQSRLNAKIGVSIVVPVVEPGGSSGGGGCEFYCMSVSSLSVAG